ncbi:hypothetical protein ABZS86_34665 [Streptomyces sp. NPDC005355]|uniref:hypothetical protein n=1 Tax=Streptomyces sp. NPDC005355 TaxID=3157038 RepID=UPI0033B3386C
MSEQTPSQAEGEPMETTATDEEESGHRDVPRTPPSQAEGGREHEVDEQSHEERAGG